MCGISQNVQGALCPDQPDSCPIAWFLKVHASFSAFIDAKCAISETLTLVNGFYFTSVVNALHRDYHWTCLSLFKILTWSTNQSKYHSSVSVIRVEWMCPFVKVSIDVKRTKNTDQIPVASECLCRPSFLWGTIVSNCCSWNKFVSVEPVFRTRPAVFGHLLQMPH